MKRFISLIIAGVIAVSSLLCFADGGYSYFTEEEMLEYGERFLDILYIDIPFDRLDGLSYAEKKLLLTEFLNDSLGKRFAINE